MPSRDSQRIFLQPKEVNEGIAQMSCDNMENIKDSYFINFVVVFIVV